MIGHNSALNVAVARLPVKVMYGMHVIFLCKRKGKMGSVSHVIGSLELKK